MYPSPLKGINSTVLSKSQTWMTAATHSEFSIKSNSCLKDIPTSPGLCFDEEKVHNSPIRTVIVSQGDVSDFHHIQGVVGDLIAVRIQDVGVYLSPPP